MPDIRRTPEERTMLCKAWKQSGLSKMKFCSQNSVSRSSLYAWLRRCKNNNNHRDHGVNTAKSKTNVKSDPIRFLKVCHTIPQKSISLESDYLEIVLPNGVGFKARVSQSNVDKFLQELLRWK